MKTFSLFACFVAALCLTAGAQSKPKSYVFHGKVEAVNPSAKSLTVANDKIDGWMDAMTMSYAVDKPDTVLKELKPGDRIQATVYDGDYVLHDVKVVPPGDAKAKK